jgi:hypothetical protein
VTEYLTAIWGSGPDDIYAVGDDGTIVHSEGDGRWELVPVDTTWDLQDVWGTGADSVYVVGQAGTVLHRF